MIAVFINCLTVIFGGIAGLLVGKKINDSFKEIVFACAGLVTIVMGIQMALESSNYLALLISLLIGGFLGHVLKIEEGILKLGEIIAKKTHSDGNSSESARGNFGLGFLNASVLFCSGAMAVVGSIQAGSTGDLNTILIKSVMDGCMAVVFASIYGVGVIFSALFILLYQGFFTLAGTKIEPLIGALGITELSAAGGILLLMIGLGILNIKKFKTANFMPALIFAPVFANLLAKIF